jgi:putative redox protein
MTKIKIIYKRAFETECVHEDSQVKILTTPPRDVDSQGGTTFSPTDLLAAGLGSCMVTMMAMAAKKEAFDLKGCVAEVEKEMVSAPHRRIGRLMIRIRSPQKPIEVVRLKLEKAALECPVFFSLHPDIKKEIDFIWGL